MIPRRFHGSVPVIGVLVLAAASYAVAMRKPATKPEADPFASVRVEKKISVSLSPAASLNTTLWDETGRLGRPVGAVESGRWLQELRRGTASAHRQALLHLRLGEYQMAAREELRKAEWHFRAAKRLTQRTDRLHGDALYHEGVAQYYQCAYAPATETFRSLLDPKNHLTGFVPTYAALWYKHAAACQGYHDSHAALGIPQPPELDPKCAATALAMCRRELGLPHAKKDVIPFIRISGRGSSDRDIAVACAKMGDVKASSHAADRATLEKLPKPLIAFVEHDHFVAVLKTDKKGVTYSCSDCGPWPGGRVSLTWKQWNAMDASEAIPIEEVEEGAASEESLDDPVFTAGGAPDDFPNYHCGFDIASLRCLVSPTCPTFHGGQGAGGASCPDPVNLSTLEEEFSPEPDMVVYNPTGPSVVWQRMYNSMRGPDGQPGSETIIGTGWSHPYNVWISMSGYNEPRSLVLANGSRIQFTRDSAQGGWSDCSLEPTAVGTPIRIREFRTGDRTPQSYPNDPNAGQQFQWIVFYPDGTSWTSAPSAAVNQGGYISGYTPFRYIHDAQNNAIYLETVNRGAINESLRVRQTGPTGLILLQVNRNNDEVVAADCYGRSVHYAFETPQGPGVTPYQQRYRLLTEVSGLSSPSGGPGIAFRSQYDYAAVYGGGEVNYCLTRHTVPSPSGTGTAAANIKYKTDGTMEVEHLTDAHGYRTFFDKLSTTKTRVRICRPVIDPGIQVDPNMPDWITVSSYTVGFDNHMSETSRTDGTNTQLIYEAGFTGFARQPAWVRDGSGKTSFFTYDNYGRVLTATSPRNVTTQYIYEQNAPGPFPRLITVQSPGVADTHVSYYGASPRVASVNYPSPTGSGTETASFEYDALGNVTRVIAPGPNGAALVNTFSYTADGSYTKSAAIGQPIAVKDSNGATVAHMRYDDQGNLISAWDGKLRATQITYNGAGQPVNVYFQQDATTSSVQPDHTTTTYRYPGGPAYKSTLYDSDNHVVREYQTVLGPEGETLGAVSTGNEAEPYSVVYDAANRVVKMNHPNGTQTTTTFNLAGYPATVSRPGPTANTFQTTQYLSYDPAGRLLTARDAKGVVTRYTYNTPDGALSQVEFSETDGTTWNGNNSKNNTAFTYDNYGRLKTRADSMSTETLYYMANTGMLHATTTQFNGPLSPSLNSSAVLAMVYYYNADGSRRALETPGGWFSYQYDALGRIAEVRNPVGHVAKYAYRPNGTDSGELQTVSVGIQDGTTFNAVHTTNYATDHLGRTKGISTRQGIAGAVLAQYTDIGYNLAGNRATVTSTLNGNNAVANTFIYDAKDRLINHIGELGSRTFNYDVMGNLTTFEGGASGSYNSANQRINAGFVYDANGDPTQHNGKYTTFDCQGNLARVSEPNQTFQARYSASGQRVLKESGGNITNRTLFLYDGSNPVCELDEYARVKAVNSFGATGLLSRTTFAHTFTPIQPEEPGDGKNDPDMARAVPMPERTFDPCESQIPPCWPSPNPTATVSTPGPEPTTGTPNPDPSVDPTPSPDPSPVYSPLPPGNVQSEVFYVFDERGNAVLRLDKTGAVLSEHKYQAYGKETTTRTAASGANSDPWGFGAQYGYYTDHETGFVYCTFRYYDPATGRWLSQDPIGLGGGQQNLYAYCGGDPINFADPSGLDVGWAQRGVPWADPYMEAVNYGGKWFHNKDELFEFMFMQLPDVDPDVFGKGTGPATSEACRFIGGAAQVWGLSGGIGRGGGGKRAPIAITGRKGGSTRGRQFNQQRAAIGRGPAEAEFRAWLQSQGMTLKPKANGSAPGPDAEWQSGTFLGWNFAELKPHTPQGIQLGTDQVYQRFTQGYQGPGAVYTWDGDGTPGKFIFRQAGLITPPLDLGL